MQRACGFGHVYDADQYASCPYCNKDTRAIFFDEPTPFSKSTGAGGARRPDDCGKTGAPDSYGRTQDADIGKTEIPESYKRRMEQERKNRTVGIYQRQHGFEPVVGWLVCIAGPDMGRDYRLYSRINTIGRSEDNDVVLAAEPTVSQKCHARLAYDSKHNRFQLIPGEGSNVIYLNDEPVFTPQPLNAYDILEFGETKLLFQCLCSDRFRWPEKKKEEA